MMDLLFWIYLLSSGFLVAFGQPSWGAYLGAAAGAFGFALFWKAMCYFPEKKHRFWLSVFWFALIQAVQLSWMTSTYYVGSGILFVYLFLLFALGLQFGFLSLFISSGKSISFHRCLALSGCWVFLEWMRIFFLTGFTWNPVGLALGCSPYSTQLAALFGVYGLSFWVILVNLCAWNSLFCRQMMRSKWLWGILAFFPYVFGWLHQNWVEIQYEKSATPFSVALIETKFSVEQKYGNPNEGNEWLSPLAQWAEVWKYLKPDIPVDLIVLPEGAFPGAAFSPYYSLEDVKEEWVQCFGENSLTSFPPLKDPLAFVCLENNKICWKVSNAFLSQALSNYFHSDVILGLNDEEPVFRYNAAFCFHPQQIPERYVKRILAPVGEYIPLGSFSWISNFIGKNFGIYDSFDVGNEANVFSGSIPVGVAICLEEVYSSVVRELRQNGARLLVSLSNDGWFPCSRLPQQHFDHGRIRSVENGVYLLRSSNMGITGGVDCLGRSLDCLPLSNSGGSALYLSLPIYSYPTLYTWWGDAGILFFSAFCLFFSFLPCRFNRKSCS